MQDLESNRSKNNQTTEHVEAFTRELATILRRIVGRETDTEINTLPIPKVVKKSAQKDTRNGD